MIHDSDCALHNEPALPKGDCDCSARSLPDALVEKAARAIYDTDRGRTSWEDAPDWMKEGMRISIRAALEAAAPSLRAQGMREAIETLDGDSMSYKPKLWARRKAILARAAEIEGGKG